MKAYRVNAQKRLRLSAPFRGAVVFMFALAANLAAQVTTIYIDAYDQPAATGWNQIRLSSAGTYSNLVDSTGADIPVWMQVTTAISGPNANSANPPTGDAAEFAPAGQNQCFGSTTPSVSVVRGLDPDCVYTFTFYGSRVGVTDNRDTRFLVEGATAGSNILATANNTSEVAIVPHILPTGAGDITITIDQGPDNTAGYYYVLALKITEIPFESTLDVEGSPAKYGTVAPPYGLSSGLEPDETFLCSAPTGTLVAADTWVTCTGYAIYTNILAPRLAQSGATNEVVYTHDGFARLIWQWVPTFLVSIVAGDGGSVDNGGGWYDAGATVTVTATPDDASQAFVKWSGDVPAAQIHDPVLQLTCDGPLNITSHFGKAWYVATTGSDTENDGLTPAAPFATIAKGIASASAGDVVLVGPGNYNVATPMTVDKGITIRGTAGANQTMVMRTAGSPTIQLGHADAVVEGIHFTKGNSQSVKILAAGGTYRKCIMSGSTYTSGSGLGVNMVAGRLSQCIITNNAGSDSTSGPGLYISGGIAENCLMANNRSAGNGAGGGVYMAGGTVRNCTIVRNRSGKGGVYATGGTMENCIVWDNSVQGSHFQVVSTSANAKFFNCYVPPLAGDNLGVFTDCVFTNTAPNFRDAAAGDYRLTLGSPCVDRGRDGPAPTAGGHDLDGCARLVGARVDIGAFEFDPGAALACDIEAPLLEGVGTLDVTLAAVVAGAAPGSTPTYAWTTNNAPAGTSATLPLSLNNPGYYTVGLSVNDGAATASVMRTNLLYVAPPILYVAEGNAGAAFPFATPATAAAAIQSAIDAARDGCVVEVGPGSYGLNASIMLDKPIELRTQAGPPQTRLYKTISDVVMLQLGHSQARFHGFDFDGGRPHVVRIWGNGGVVSNCYIRNGFYTSGNGVGLRALAGLVTHCAISNNTCNNLGAGVAAYLEGTAAVENCLIVKNSSSSSGTKGGVYLKNSAVLRNCTVAGNRAGNGGGVYTDGGGTVENCILYGNQATAAPGAGDPDWYNVGTAAVYRNNCTPIDIGTDCVTALPNFIDAASGDYRISPGSLCVDAGREDDVIATMDYFGNPRISGETVDIGCYEVVITEPSCDILADSRAVLEGQLITLTAVAIGFPPEAELTYAWDFDGDEVADATGESVSRLFPNGRTSVTLSVTDGTTSVSVDKPELLMVSPLNLYVLPENAQAAFPFDSWEQAATNIQEAIDTALDGSTIWVGDGLYRINQRLDLMKGATLRSVSGRPDTVHVVQNGSAVGGRVLYVAHASAIVQGLTLRNGVGGVMMDRAGGTLVDLVISNNTFGAGGGLGAGLLIYAGSVRRCVIVNNRMTSNSSVAGIAIPARVGPEDPPVLIENCLIVSNASTSILGTIGAVHAQNGTLRNCTIVGNVASNAASAGGVQATTAALIENCIVTDNVNLQSPAIANWAGTATSFRYTCSTPDLGGTGNLTDDPKFVDPAAGDFRLLAGSPCINTGLTLEGMAAEADLSGGRRVWQRFVDLGAIEFVPPAGTLLMVR